ncbi:MAG TPA: S8 family serine peptidase [Gaiellaceae bacterium]|nr:S8 family serine peptidase [Gaiellaceae bacterium]
MAASAAAGVAGPHKTWGFNTQGLGKTSAYVPGSLASAIQQTPNKKFDVIVEGNRAKSGGGLRNSILDARSGSNAIGGAQIRRTFRAINGLHAMLTGSQIAFLARTSYVSAIVPNARVEMSSIQLPQTNGQKWAWTIGAPVDWTTQASTLTEPSIAVVDSGIDTTRADFGSRVVDQVSLASLSPNSPGDGYGHGTFVAGIAAGGADGFAGVAPEANLVSIDVMDDQGESTVADIVSACDWILQHKAADDIRVANFSLQTTDPTSLFFDPIDQAVEKLWLNGVVVVAASGNFAQDGAESGVPYAPGNDPFVITVGATDVQNTVQTADDTVAPWSAWGYTPDGFMKPEISAPGRYVIGPVSAGAGLTVERSDRVITDPAGYMQLSGTSFATPMVSGAAAMLLAQHPDWTPDQVKGALMVSASATPAAAPGSTGVGELDVALARRVTTPPNPNAGLDQFLTTAADGTVTFDSSAWQAAAQSSAAWSDAAWSDAAWSDAAWSDAAWGSAAWGSAAWSDAAWSDAAWSDAAWSDAAWGSAAWSDAAWGSAAWGSAAWSDAAWGSAAWGSNASSSGAQSDSAADDPSIDPNATAVTDDEMTMVESNLGIVDPSCDPSLNACTAP